MANTEDTYELGDLIIIILEKNYTTNQIFGIYKSFDTELDEVTIYPLDKNGLDLAKFDAGDTQTLIHREEPFTISNFKNARVILIEEPGLTLDSLQKYYYDQIQAKL